MAPKRKAAAAEAGAAEPPKKKAGGGGKLAVGSNVGACTAALLRDDGVSVTLAEITKDKGAVFFMYPRANTGGCTKQACGFQANAAAFKKAGYDVYGLSYDKPASQKNWQSKYSLKDLRFLTDDGTALKALGAFKPPKNILRSHVVVAKGGEVVDMRNGISPGDSFAEALAFVTKK